MTVYLVESNYCYGEYTPTVIFANELDAHAYCERNKTNTEHYLYHPYVVQGVSNDKSNKST